MIIFPKQVVAQAPHARKGAALKASNEAKRPAPVVASIVKQNAEVAVAARAHGSPPTDAEPRPSRLISKAEVLDRTGLSFPSIWKMMRDGTFPRSRAVGGKSMWIEAEVEAWITSLPLRRLKGDDEEAA